MRIRKVIAGISLSVGLSGAGVVAAAPQLVVGSGAAAGLPTVCINDKFCEPGGPFPVD